MLREGIGVAVIPGNDKAASELLVVSTAELRNPAKREYARGRIDRIALHGITALVIRP
jgi:hypothetical protein